MLNGYEYWDDFRYSIIVDFLLNWAHIYFIGPPDDSELRRLQSEWDVLMSDKDVVVSLRAGVERLNKQVDQALKLLYGPKSLDLDLEEAWQIQDALSVLDDVVLLSEALNHFSGATGFPENFRREVDALLVQVTVDRAPSGVRLIPLNDWRSQVLKQIPAKYRYLFPWYKVWADVAADTLDRLVEGWDGLAHGRMDTVEIDECTLAALLAELNADKELLEWVRNEAGLSKLIPQAIEQSFALRIFILSTEGAASVSIPEVVEERGLVASACKAIREWPGSEFDKAEIRFLAAFCGPLLTDGQRIEMLSKVEQFLKDVQPDRLIEESALLSRLYNWSERIISDQDLANFMFAKWMPALEAAAKEIMDPVPDAEVDFWAEVNKELKKRWFINNFHRIFEKLKDLFGQEQTLIGPAVVWAGREGRREITRYMAPYLELEIRPEVTTGGSKFKLPTFPQDSALQESRIDRIRDFNECYMWGAGWKEDGEQVDFALRHLKPIRPYSETEDDRGFSQIMVCLGTKKEDVELAKGIIQKWFDPQEEKKEIRVPRGVVIISYKVNRAN